MTKALSILGFSILVTGMTVQVAAAASSKVTSSMGHELAKSLCATCHLIEPGQTNPAGHVGGPAFQTIADRTDVTRDKLRSHLLKTHSNAMIPLSMPNPRLSQDELNKIIDYLLSLKTTPAH